MSNKQQTNTSNNKSNIKSDTKYIFVTGGVVSSVGKGITAACIASVLKARDFKVTMMKLDPYINVDAGTMSPFQHGEVFVTIDGCESDLDLGHYERFCNIDMKKINSCTAGKIYSEVIDRERRGYYLGQTVQVIPHITDEIKNQIYQACCGYDISVVEIGGTVGDIESLPFIESIRQIKLDLKYENTLFLHISYVPYLQSSGEIKTKPTQHSIRDMRSIGLQPDVLICRSERIIDEKAKSKIALFSNLHEDQVIGMENVDSIYKIPLKVHDSGLDEIVLKHFKLESNSAKVDLSPWQKCINSKKNSTDKVVVCIIGKYSDLEDSYLSLFEALDHAGIHCFVKVDVKLIESQTLIDNSVEMLKDADAIIIPGGFGSRGVKGKLKAINYARENKIPFLGICLGMQLCVIEFAQNVCSLNGANSSEFEEAPSEPIVGLIEEWMSSDGIMKVRNTDYFGGTMRLGASDIVLDKKSIVFRSYKSKVIKERHRHRYECNENYVPILKKHGMNVVGRSSGNLVEVVELDSDLHPWFVGCQFHPEFTSRPQHGHKLFISMIERALEYKGKNVEI